MAQQAQVVHVSAEVLTALPPSSMRTTHFSVELLYQSQAPSIIVEHNCIEVLLKANSYPDNIAKVSFGCGV